MHKGEKYTHLKTGNEYRIFGVGLMRGRIGWIRSVTYVNDNDEIFTQQIDEFNRRFIPSKGYC